MSMLRTITAAGALAVMATGAFAGSIKWDGTQSAFTNVNFTATGAITSNARAGALNMTDTGNSIVSESLGSNSWLAWCLDLMTTVKTAAEYDLTDTPYTSAPITAQQRQNVQALFEGNFGSVDAMIAAAGNTTLSAAFQVALWEGFYDSVTGFDLTAGNFDLNSPAGVATQAATYLTAAAAWLAAPEAKKFALHFLEGSTPQNVRSQNLMTVTAAVPLPAAGLLLLGGLAVLGAAARRRAA